jgi:hypothetical protein
MSDIRIQVGSLRFVARWEDAQAPRTIAAVKGLLPFRNKIIQARWSGEAAWVPLGDLKLGLDWENHTSHPAPGDLLIYPGTLSECELLFAYGATLFASKMGQLAGNHFATVIDDRDALATLGRLVLWEGAQDILIEEG